MKSILSASVDSRIMDEIERRRGLVPRSAYVERLLRIGLSSNVDLGELAGAKVVHVFAVGRRGKEKFHTILESSMVYPVGGAPFGWPHLNVDLGLAVVKDGMHTLKDDPARCDGCRRLVEEMD
jgi:hypothetical protein